MNGRFDYDIDDDDDDVLDSQPLVNDVQIVGLLSRKSVWID